MIQVKDLIGFFKEEYKNEMKNTDSSFIEDIQELCNDAYLLHYMKIPAKVRVSVTLDELVALVHNLFFEKYDETIDEQYERWYLKNN